MYFFEIFDFSHIPILLLPLCRPTSPHYCRIIAILFIAIAVAIHSITLSCKVDCCCEQSLALSFVLVTIYCALVSCSVSLPRLGLYLKHFCQLTLLSPCLLCVLAPFCYCLLLVALPMLEASTTETEQKEFHHIQSAEIERQVADSNVSVVLPS